MDRKASRQPEVNVSNAAIPRVDVLGVAVHAIDMRVAIEQIASWIAKHEQHYVCVTGVHGVMEAQQDPELRAIHNRSGLTAPDGMPLVWAAHYAGALETERVCGTELFPAVAEHAARAGWKFFFYGGKEGVPELLADRLMARFPGLRIVGTYAPPFRPLTHEEDDALAKQINASDPDIVWVGLSTPKQEQWMAAHVGRVNAPVLIGVGAAFDLHAGLSHRSPKWMQRIGLEWLYRMITEPRLATRYLKNNPRFVWNIARSRPRLLEPHESP
jgi:N-acetylglucosaminyldiphosphoundecaprenol N-acetyl-beta-D-mannosaminyltransferase